MFHVKLVMSLKESLISMIQKNKEINIISKNIKEEIRERHIIDPACAY